MSKTDQIDGTPINRVAYWVTRPHSHYRPDIKSGEWAFKTPPAVKPIPRAAQMSPTFEDFTGARLGRLVVLGLSEQFNGRWVTRCACGNYQFRTSKALKNTDNPGHACRECRYLDHLKWLGNNS